MQGSICIYEHQGLFGTESEEEGNVNYWNDTLYTDTIYTVSFSLNRKT